MTMPLPDPIDEAEEQRLARRIADGDRAARDELAGRWSWLVAEAARGLRLRRQDEADAFAEGIAELFRVATEFRPGAGRFRDAAFPAIRRAMRRATRRWNATVLSLEWAAERAFEVDRDDATSAAIQAAMLSLTEPERAAVRERHGIDGKRRPGGRTPTALGSGERKLRAALARKEGT